MDMMAILPGYGPATRETPARAGNHAGTRFGQKMRPEFTIVEWRQIGGGGLQNEPARQIEQRKPNPAEQIGRPVKPVTTEEERNDRIRF